MKSEAQLKEQPSLCHFLLLSAVHPQSHLEMKTTI